MNCFTHTLPPLQSYSPLSARFKEFPELFLEAEGLTLSPAFCAGCWTHCSFCLQDLGDNHATTYRIHKPCVAKLLNCPYFRLGLRIPSSTRSWVAFSFFRCKTARERDRFRERFVCVCVCCGLCLQTIECFNWSAWGKLMKIAQFKLHTDVYSVYLYTVFGCTHAILQQFSLCFSIVMCEWRYIGRFTGTCLYIVK